MAKKFVNTANESGGREYEINLEILISISLPFVIIYYNGI